MIRPLGTLGREVITHTEFVETKAKHVPVGGIGLSVDGQARLGEHATTTKSVCEIDPCFQQRTLMALSPSVWMGCSERKICVVAGDIQTGR